jgi:predicted small lipoprotein YifL
MIRIWTIATLLIGALLLAACGQVGPTPIPPPPTALPEVDGTAEQTAATTAVVVSPTDIPVEATLPPPPTIAPLPTSTPEGNDAAGVEGIITADDFGTDRNPLTGELVDNPANLQRRPIAVKLSNAPAKYTRPQSGLNDADLIFEHTTEGNITRFTAIFYGETPPKVGPVRSARLIDLELPAMYDAALAYSGSSKGVAERLRNSDFRPRILYAWDKGYYRTDENKPVEHTLYGNPELLWEALSEKEQNVPPTFTSTNIFSDDPPPGGTPASSAEINYNWTVVDWHYDPISASYLRWADGVIHADGNTDEQVSVANVIVISPFHAFDGKICEQTNADGSCAGWSVEVQLWGSGNATVFRDGQRYDLIWHRDNRTDSLTFTDSNGDPFPLKIGNSWVQVVPSWLKNPLTVTP